MWISVLDKLPSDDSYVLVAIRESYGIPIRIGFYANPSSWADGAATWDVMDEHGMDYCDGVTHWMPLPNKPQTDQTAEANPQ